MDGKKIIVLVMNCAADAIKQYLYNVDIVRKNYDIKIVTTYVNINDRSSKEKAEEIIKNADVLISQDVKNIDWLRNDYMSKIIKNNCNFIRLAFWRFDGYWPIKLDRYNNSMWYFPEEFGYKNTFDEYMSGNIDYMSTIYNFESEVEKFSKIEINSDLKMIDFFNNNHKEYRLFSDNWHPSSYFFFQVSKYILDRLGIEDNFDVIPCLNINMDRFRFILPSVYENLNLNFDQTILSAHGYYTTINTFFEFSKYAKHALATANSPSQASDCFKSWIEMQGIQLKLTNIATWATASQSSKSVWSKKNEPQGAIDGTNNDPYSFHTGFEYSPWILIDLKDIRAIDSIIISNRADYLRDRALPLHVLVSIDCINWKEIAVCNYEFGSSRTQGRPLIMNFEKPITVKYIKILSKKYTWLHLDQIEIYCQMISC
jgi:F5/8 type C domain/Polysaccharide biosynthesis enzyme WcbI